MAVQGLSAQSTLGVIKQFAHSFTPKRSLFKDKQVVSMGGSFAFNPLHRGILRSYEAVLRKQLGIVKVMPKKQIQDTPTDTPKPLTLSEFETHSTEAGPALKFFKARSVEKTIKDQALLEGKQYWKKSTIAKAVANIFKTTTEAVPELAFVQLGFAAVGLGTQGVLAKKEVQGGNDQWSKGGISNYRVRTGVGVVSGALKITLLCMTQAVLSTVAAPVSMVGLYLGIRKANKDIVARQAQAQAVKADITALEKAEARRTELLKQLFRTSGTNKTERIRIEGLIKEEQTKIDSLKETKHLYQKVLKAMERDIMGNRVGVLARALIASASTIQLVLGATALAGATVGVAAIPILGQVAVGLLIAGVILYAASTAIRILAQNTREKVDPQAYRAQEQVQVQASASAQPVSVEVPQLGEVLNPLLKQLAPVAFPPLSKPNVVLPTVVPDSLPEVVPIKVSPEIVHAIQVRPLSESSPFKFPSTISIAIPIENKGKGFFSESGGGQKDEDLANEIYNPLLSKTYLQPSNQRRRMVATQ